MILNNFKESPVVIANQFKEKDQKTTENFYIFGFKKSIIIIKQTSINILQTFLSSNTNATIFFLSNSKEFFQQHMKIQNKQLDSDQRFINEIQNFCKNFNIKSKKINSINEIWKSILFCITGYLIKQGYEKFYNRHSIDFTQEIKEKEFEESEFILLRDIGRGSSNSVELIYHIEREELLALKKPIKNNIEEPKLTSRETYNYHVLNHSRLPKFYGIVAGTNFLVIEFIDGKTLEYIKHFHLNESEKIRIILELMIIIRYFHKNDFVYRDLKPNNVMIDENKRIFIIDFDRMIKYSESSRDSEHTQDFGSIYAAPEVNQSIISYKNDIYSIGQMIFYIISERNTDIESFENNSKIIQIHKMCTEINYEKRPSILQLIFLFCLYFQSQIQVLMNQNDPEIHFIHDLIYYGFEYVSYDINKVIYYYSFAADHNIIGAQFILANIFSRGQYIARDLKKAIHYYTLVANQECQEEKINFGSSYFNATTQNIIESQFSLGILYYAGQHIPQSINKAIQYFTLASNHNHSHAQVLLGSIYYIGKWIQKDINKAFQLYSLAASQNDPQAYFFLGEIYRTGEYDGIDVDKAIYYFTLAANQNEPNAQYNLGCLYSSDKYISQNINKAIYYFTLAANQNHIDAQINLGIIYSSGKYITRDINKAIHFFTLAANRNSSRAQFELGSIYMKGEYIERDINKAIHYFLLASNQNYPDAQVELGNIYMKGEYITRDINKAIRYFSLAVTQNHPDAQYNLGMTYLIGKYVTKNASKAIYFLTLAANQNSSRAQFVLGSIYMEGEYTERDINKAIHYFLLAANQNYPDAQFELGYIYLFDKYNVKDIKKGEYITIDFIYTFTYEIVPSTNLLEKKIVNPKDSNVKDISNQFYEGFGIPI